MTNVPRLDDREADDIFETVRDSLKNLPLDKPWQDREGGAGQALLHLFGRLAELVITRLNQTPEKHFLAFLDEAGVSLLPPRPASAEIIFTAAEDGPDVITVPAGTQVATLKTETRPEVVFETQQDVNITPNELVHCFAFDPRDYADRMAQAMGQRGGAFPAFSGRQERERILFLGDPELFSFADDASRQAAKITLSFEFAAPGDPTADGWILEWLYWNGVEWTRLEDAGGMVADGTHKFSQNGEVQLHKLPNMAETEVGGRVGQWIACQLTGGVARDHLPILKSVKGGRQIEITSRQVAAVGQAYTSIQANTSFVPLDDLTKEFFPLGQRPARLDAFYLMSQEAFAKPGALISLETSGLAGVPAAAASPELDNLKLEWQYYSEKGWTLLGTSTRQKVTAARLEFDDQTLAFTQGDSGQQVRYISFKAPSRGGADPLFKKTMVNNLAGYWIRAQLTDGGYNVPSSVNVKNRLSGDYEFIESKTYAPFIKSMALAYQGYKTASEAKSISLCFSKVDGMAQEHCSALAANTSVAGFSARDEGPALYLGFAKVFPAGKWIQLLLDAEEQTGTQMTPFGVIWEYWNGSRWAFLKVSDGSQGLTRRGYLGFYSPDDHQMSTEFGRLAAWLRVRPLPRADAGPDQTVFINNTAAGETRATLDASRSGQKLHRYYWRLVSPVADAGPDRTFRSTVKLDASAAKGAARYIWRRVEQSVETEKQVEQAAALPYLRTIRPNTASALNAVTIRDEVLGSSNGKKNQTFNLAHPPVHADQVQIAVREPDRPPKVELEALEKELQQFDDKAQALLSPPEETSPWVCWRQTPDFFASTSADRHFILDSASGVVRFGDGKRGMIPPAGRDNIKAGFYRTHAGNAGNMGAGLITVLRNPGDALADIRVVENLEAAAGGSNQEEISSVKLRGPWSLKHRHQAVTQGGFKWLASETGSEVARTYCLPACNPAGLPEAGWVTVVIIPRSEAAKPVPDPALLRRVKKYLEEQALVNLTAGTSRIYVKGPEYVEASVLARIVARDPATADDVKLAVLDRLGEFLHPLKGGPERDGWELGRDVYLSEIYDEIETAPGVDHVEQLQLQGSLWQQQLSLLQAGQTPFDIPAGSEVSTLDKRVKLLLAEPMFKEIEFASLSVYSFKAGDEVAVVAADNRVLKDKLVIAGISANFITFTEPFEPPAYFFSRCDALLSSDHRLRLPLACPDPADQVKGVAIQKLQPGDQVSIIAYGQRYPGLDQLRINRVESCDSRIFIPEGHLIYSGNHKIEIVLE